MLLPVQWLTVFERKRDDIWHFGELQHDIEVYNKRPIYARPFKMPNSVEEEVEKKRHICRLVLEAFKL